MVYIINKQSLLEEAAHAGDPKLNKNNLQKTGNARNRLSEEITNNRKLRDAFQNGKKESEIIYRDSDDKPKTFAYKIETSAGTNTDKALIKQQANYHDNKAREISQTGRIHSGIPKEAYLPKTKFQKIFKLNPDRDYENIDKLYNSKPRSIASARS